MVSADEILKKLKEKAQPDQLKGMAQYGIVVEKRLGVSMPELRKMAKELGKDHKIALNLWKTGIADAQLLAGMIDEPEKITENQMEDWVKDINSWDVCDQLCANLFEKTPLAWKKIHDWSKREEEFVKRTAYALIACLAWHDKEADDRKFIKLLPVIEFGATDERNFVKKAVNWALRNIGKRNRKLNKVAINTARKIGRINSKTARWVASDAIRELNSGAVKKRLSK
ncbi:DNA alkylation repair protein [[Eubacterium] cellulosolvens]